LAKENIPGLAMSRSIGDGVAMSVGVIPDPEILDYTTVLDDKFMVVASDGVFEFLTNEDVVRIVVPYWKIYDVQGACDALVKRAH
jgi:serine/threonine protein phosphatase PrpC